MPIRNLSPRERFNISRLAIAYPWITLGFWLAVTVAGVLAFSSLKYALFPDITFPVVVVNASVPLRTALDTEAKLTQPLEQSLSSIVDDVRSSTYPGQTAISLSFPVGANLEASSRKIETALKQVALPKGATFKVISLNLNESAATSYAVESSTQNLSQLTKIARDQIVPSISQLPGVLKVELLGTPELRTPNSELRTPNSELPTPTAVLFNGKDAIAFEVIKQGSANTLEVVGRVEKEVMRLRSALPDVQLTLAATQADYIREATQATTEALLLAVVLAVVVIFPFLRNWQATLISALAIPTSLLGTFIVMAICGFNLETITLLALVLVIGIIIDDAIVDVENIARHIEAGATPRRAAIAATNEIGLTVTAATFTIVAVFLPVGLMGGVVGQFFKPFGLTVSAAVIASLLVARTLSPLLASKWLKPKEVSHKGGTWTGLYQHYRVSLSWSLNHRRMVLSLAILSLAIGVGLIPLIPKGFIPKLDRGEFNITYTAPANTSLSQSHSYAQKLEKFVLSFPQQVQTVFTTVGSSQGEPNKGNLYVKLRRDRTIRTPDLEDQFRRQLPVIPDVTTSIEDIKFVDTGDENPLQIALLGDDLVSLDRTAKQIKERIQNLPGFADVTATGIGRSSNSIPDKIFEIEHLKRRRVAYVSANLGQNLSLGQATDEVVKEARALLPAGISLDLGGDSARSGEIFSSFGTTLGLSVLCILVVLILLFQSWVAPVVIISALPLALVGATIALFVTRSEFGMISVIGIIFLLGLTNKNAIIIVDYINQLRRTGLSRTESILQAGPMRLRPILMTTAAAILGMLPIALGLGAGSELRAPMAIAIIGGLIASTLLSLIVVPTTYALVDDWSLFVFQRKSI